MDSTCCETSLVATRAAMYDCHTPQGTLLSKWYPVSEAWQFSSGWNIWAPRYLGLQCGSAAECLGHCEPVSLSTSGVTVNLLSLSTSCGHCEPVSVHILGPL